ncbi:MAG: hypothetical protein LBV42_04385 [Methanobrevibacter sp.]|jgi:hypothetical protein|nr:hypothetical protein [Methanobrevibacter sp.]
MINIKFKSAPQLSKELDIHRHTVGRYHKKIHEYLLENNLNLDDVEMDEA